RTFSVSGTPVEARFSQPILPDNPRAKTFLGYERLPDGVRIRWRALFTSGTVEVTETLEISWENGHRQIRHEKRATLAQLRAYDLPAAQTPQPAQRAELVDAGG